MRVKHSACQVLPPWGLTASCFCPLAALVDHIQFGDCRIGNSYSASFTITNHSQVNVMRFEWPLLATVSFSPQVSENQSLFPGLP